MIRRILVPLGDLGKEQPILAVARRSFPEAELQLLHVLETPHLPVVASPEAAMAEMFVSRDVQETFRVRETEAREALARLGAGAVAATGDPASEILRRARDHDLVLMGTRGRRGLERWLLGSVAERVTRESTVPVLTVPTTLSRPAGPFEHVLFVRDFSGTAQRAQEALARLWPEAAVTALHVTQDISLALHMTHHPLAFGLLYEQNCRMVRERRAAVQSQGGRLIQGDAAAAALHQLQNSRFDLLVIGTEARSPLERFFQGSVVGQVIRDANIPVLTLRPGAQRPSSPDTPVFVSERLSA